jgi:hypothetical protein
MYFKTTPLRYFSYLFALAAVLFLQSCRKNDFQAITQPEATTFSAKVASDWMEQTRLIVKAEGKNPPQASRIYAYAAIALYESVLPGLNGYQSLSNQIEGLTNLPNVRDFGVLDYTIAVNEALYQVNLKVYGNIQSANVSNIEKLHSQYYNERVRAISPEKMQSSIEFGKMVATAVLNRANSDNFSATRSMVYTVPDWANNSSYWTPTDATNLIPLEPYWGKVKCFAMKSSNECEVPSTLLFSTTIGTAFHKQALEVYTTSVNLTANEKSIASWWADGGGTPTPPGHWVSIENQLVKDLNLSLGKAAEMYALVNMGMADAFISCWDAKYKFNLVRPQTYIRNFVAGAANWKPFIGTPPFPEYPSGHSVSSGVAAEILTNLFGNVAFTDYTNTNMGLAARSYKSFDEAAQEAAISRLYGGIHYREACDKGVQQGKLVAKSIITNIKLRK